MSRGNQGSQHSNSIRSEKPGGHGPPTPVGLEPPLAPTGGEVSAVEMEKPGGSGAPTQVRMEKPVALGTPVGLEPPLAPPVKEGVGKE